MLLFMQSEILLCIFFVLEVNLIKKLSVILCAAIVASYLTFFIPLKASASTYSVSGVGRVATSSTSLNVRSGAGTSYSVKAKLKKESYVTLISKSGNWWYLKYADGTYGYASADYITLESNNVKRVKTTYGNLSVRSGAGTGYAIVSKLPSDKDVAIISESEGWAKILYDGSKIGYVSNKYLITVSGDKYQRITISVPSYKQTDTRWSTVKMGNSSATIGKKGCMLTAFAMTESYRTGTTITPDVMAKRSSFTSSGDMYWPKGYVADYTSSYLSKIYSLLKEGKPVLIGGKDKYGSTHWVVVKGFIGGDNLTLASFLINDPGSNTNTTLADFKAKFTSHIRIMYYQG